MLNIGLIKKVNNLIQKLKWAIRESRKNGHPYISSGKLEEYIQEYEVATGNISSDMVNKDNKKNGDKYDKKNSVVDFVLDIN
tara:strand:+ start:198 stop:443 length:246 start_codon:yes stop_codon:yes gene_type:complete